jgi:Ras-related protein Rab-1A
MVKPINIFKKVCVLGDIKVGKTSIVNRYNNNIFSEEYTPSIGTKVSKHNVEIKDPTGQTQGMLVTLMIWDLLGSRDHAMLHKTFYAGAEGGIVVCDITSENSREHISFWVENLRAVVPKETPIFIALNKVDGITQDVKEKVIHEIRDLCRKLNVAHIEVSARTGDNVNTMFYTLSETMIVTRPF